MDEVFHAQHVMFHDADALIAYCKVAGYDADEPCEDLASQDVSAPVAGQVALATATVQPQGVLAYDPSLGTCESIDPDLVDKFIADYSKWSAYGPDPPHDFLQKLEENRVSLNYW
jgi:hypothetical protein